MAEQPLIDISPENWRIVRDILQRYLPDREVWAFGSRAKWTAKEYSDLDIAVIGDEPLSIGVMAELNESFQESVLPFKVDVVDWAVITPSFRRVIEEKKVILLTKAAPTKVWGEARLDDLKAPTKGAFAMGPFGSRIKAENFGLSGVPVIKGGNLNGDFLDERSFDFLTDEKAAELSSSEVRRLDLVITHRGTIGQVGIIPETSKYPRYIASQSQLKLTFDANKVNPYFVYYFLRSPEGQHRLLANTSQVGVPAIAQALTSIRNILIPYPPKPVQDEIVSVLRSLDERMALIRATNATLEAIAQALFKSWFVDFDPVRAKAEGREPEGVPPEVVELFPSEFEESELGEIPKGWKAKPVYDLAEYINGAAYKAFSPNGEKRGLPIIKIAELKAGVTPQTAYSDVSMPDKYLLETGDILLSWSGNPDTSIGTFVWHHGRAWLNQHIFRVVIHQATERPFVLQVLKHLRPVFAETARNKQTTGLGHFTVADMKRLLVVQPNSPVLVAFGEIIAPIHARIFENEQQAITLTSLRDSLLPKLMAGNITVGGDMDA